MKFFLIILLFLLTSCVQVNKNNDEESRKLIETFFITYERNSIEKALDELFSTNAYFAMLPSHNIDAVKDKLVSYTDSIGKYCGYEIIARKSIGKSMLHYSCLVNYELQPLRFSFTLYKPKTSWMLYNFQFDTEAVNESAKFYYID